jgi:hypothetical protein
MKTSAEKGYWIAADGKRHREPRKWPLVVFATLILSIWLGLSVTAYLDDAKIETIVPP